MQYWNKALYISPGKGNLVTDKYYYEIHSPTQVLLKIGRVIEIA